jgi:hypothetical protein
MGALPPFSNARSQVTTRRPLMADTLEKLSSGRGVARPQTVRGGPGAW